MCFWKVCSDRNFGSRSTILSPLLHNTGLTFGFTGVLRVLRCSACPPPPPPHRRMACTRQGSPWRVMATYHSPGFHFHVRRWFSEDRVFSCWRLLPSLIESLFGWCFFCCFVFDFLNCSFSGHLLFVGVLFCRILCSLLRFASCLLDAWILLDFFHFTA